MDQWRKLVSTGELEVNQRLMNAAVEHYEYGRKLLVFNTLMYNILQNSEEEQKVLVNYNLSLLRRGFAGLFQHFNLCHSKSKPNKPPLGSYNSNTNQYLNFKQTINSKKSDNKSVPDSLRKTDSSITVDLKKKEEMWSKVNQFLYLIRDEQDPYTYD